jgi:hypothetical protein
MTERYSEDFSSSNYWETRYSKGKNSGLGSYGKLALFKARVINKFIADHEIRSAIEFGCGDGNNLSLFKIENYVGVDISSTVVTQNRQKFNGDRSKTFLTTEGFRSHPVQAQLGLSLDVIYHLVEDEIFFEYMGNLFDSSNQYCIIYSSNVSENGSSPRHIKRRKFTEWVDENAKAWRLKMIIFNEFPPSANAGEQSLSDFYFYEKLNGTSR